MKKTFIMIIGCLILGVMGCQQPNQETPGTTQEQTPTNYLDSYIGTWNNDESSEIVISNDKITGVIYYIEPETRVPKYANFTGTNLIVDGTNGLQANISYKVSYDGITKNCKMKAHFKSLDKTIIQIQFVDVSSKYDFGVHKTYTLIKNIY